MKNFLIAMISIACFSFISCSKTASSGEANIRFVNLAPNSSNLDFNATGSLLVGGVSYGAASLYRPISASNPAFTINATGATQTLFSGNLALQTGIHYSFFVYDSVTNMKVSLVIDDQAAPPSGKANVRFLNFYKGAVSVDIKKDGTTNLFTARTTNDHSVDAAYSKYIAVDPGTFNVSAVVAGSSVVLFQLPGFAPVAGKSYTLILRGFSAVSTGAQAIALVPVTDK
ncbi:MAG: DUF4397 domain-containing protein [Sediminibacterium sp.]|nr:DUF4397 domain-containing protein [Sediminibacterium sp.]